MTVNDPCEQRWFCPPIKMKVPTAHTAEPERRANWARNEPSMRKAIHKRRIQWGQFLRRWLHQVPVLKQKTKMVDPGGDQFSLPFLLKMYERMGKTKTNTLKRNKTQQQGKIKRRCRQEIKMMGYF